MASEIWTNPERSMLNATLLGYVAGLAWGESARGPGRNPYAYIQPEAFNWQHGFEQGQDRRVQCGVRDPLPPEPIKFIAFPKPTNRERRIWRILERSWSGSHE